MDFLPIFLNIRKQPCLVVGGGATATRKVELLLRAQAQVNVVAPNLTAQLRQWSNSGYLIHHANRFIPSDLDNCRLVIAATNDKTVNEQEIGRAHV